MQLIDTYYRDLVTRIAEEIVENREAFDVSYPGKAEEMIDRHGHHLQNVARIYNDLGTVHSLLFAQREAAMSGSAMYPVQPSGKTIGPDTQLQAGAPVLVSWHGMWFRAEVLSQEAEGMVR